jgi:hypothetical protein
MVDLESFWKRLRPPREPENSGASGKGWDLRAALVRAGTKANLELAEKFEGLDPTLVAVVATTSVQCFLEAWYEELRHGDTVSLIGVVLEGRDLTVEELKGFLMALPASLLQRICDFPSPRASGLQALIAIENERRKKLAPDYLLSRDPLDGKLVVTFYPPQASGSPVTFKLDETFEGISDPNVVRDPLNGSAANNPPTGSPDEARTGFFEEL